MSFFFFCFLTFPISRKRLTDDMSRALYSSLFSEWQELSWWFRDSVTTPSINYLNYFCRQNTAWILLCGVINVALIVSHSSPTPTQSGGGSLCVVWGPLACCRGWQVIWQCVRAQVVLELASEYVTFTIFTVSIKHSKSFKGCIWMCFFLSFSKLAALVAWWWVMVLV